MIALLRRFNDLPIFDPGRVPGREAIARVVGVVGVGAFLVRRCFLLPDFERIAAYYAPQGYSPGTIRTIWSLWLAIWVLESGIFAAYIAAFLTRAPARSVARGFAQAVFPLLLGALPFATAMTEYNFWRWMPAASSAHLALLAAILGWILLGAAINLAGLVALRRAFTIMTEARTLVRGGPFRWVRHPLYLGQFVLYLGYTLMHLHPLTVPLYVVFVAGQVVRARNEERKLAAEFPEYEEYRRTTGMFLPRWGRRTG